MASWMYACVVLLSVTSSLHGKYGRMLSEICSDKHTCQSCTNTSITCNGKDGSKKQPFYFIPVNDFSPEIRTLNLEFRDIIGLKLVGYKNKKLQRDRVHKVTKRNLTFQEYYPNLEYLNLAGNELEAIPKDVFKGLALRGLNLGINPLNPRIMMKSEDEDWGIFEQLPNIRFLNISRMKHPNHYQITKHNILQYLIPELKYLNHSKIEVIDFSETHRKTAKPYSLNMSLVLTALKETPIREIYLSNNYIDNVYFGSNKEFPELPYSRIGVGEMWNNLSTHLKHLEHFDMSNIGLDLFNSPLLIIHEGTFEKMIASNLKTFKMSSSQTPDLQTDQIEFSHLLINLAIISKLEVLKLVNVMFLRSNYMCRVSSFQDGLSFQNGNKLRILDISGPGKFSEINGEIKGLTSLEELYFNDNNCIIGQSVLSCSNGNFESLKILRLSGNLVQLNSSKEVFADCDKLIHVDLSYNKIKEISSDLLKNAKNLKSLDLSGNLLTHIDLNLAELKQMKFLNLSHNKLDKLEYFFMDKLKRIAANEGLVDLHGNPLSCKCGEIEFISWIQANKFTFHKPNWMLCTDIFSTQVNITKLNLAELKFYCIKPIIISVTATAGTIGVILLSTVLIYKYRFRIQYLALLARAQFRRRNVPDDGYYFDAFLSYSSLDKEFSHNTLTHRLEGDFGYKLCFDERNFLGGHVLEELVTVAMNHSKKIILVISEHFLRSKWCTFEMDIANGVLATRGCNCIILILRVPLNMIPAQLIKPRLRSLLENRLYIEWSEEKDRQQLFWQKLKDTLGRPCNAELTDEHRRNGYLVFNQFDTGICDDVQDELQPLLENSV
ncbi:unnamed protein product [Owenia fusiformis]|uniref:Uncharacterized protein n=1 Tax=Owenia fusiformis TaxID=6347 RepID=A0A8J1UER6_OWEFU|nr:unnamed protein product [Owenia fusiformis]